MPERPDPLAVGLAALAPAVDVAAGRQLFERHRARPPASRRWLLPAAVAILLIAGVVGVWAARQADAPDRVPAAPVDETDESDEAVGDGYELLAVAQTSRSTDSVQIAINNEDWSRALEGTDVDPADVDVDLSRSIVGVLNVAGNSCPFELDGFDVSGDVWSPRLVESGQACDAIGITWTYLVAIDRGQLGNTLTIRLPPALGGGEATVELEPDQPITSVADVPAAGPATGDEFVMLAVEATRLEFGSILVADDATQFDRMWSESFGETEQPTVDFDHLVVVAFTLPDDACPDTLTRFTIDQSDGDARAIWEPQFEPPPGGCDLPLITRTYVVGVDRAALGTAVTFRLPGDDVYDFEANTVTVDVSQPDSQPDSATSPNTSPTLTPTGVRVPLPPVGEPQLEIGTFGVLWVVHHADGSVSVLDAVVERPANEDEGGVSRLGDLVVPTATGDGFGGAGFVWDSHGRTVNGPRTSDLTGFAGEILDGEVELSLSGETTIAGDAERVTGEFVRPDLDAIPLLDLDTLPTLSFSGPIWRHFDATLVVENGVGTLCSIDPDVPVPDLATCDDGVATAVRSTLREITSWYFGPLLAEFDEFGRIVQVVPLGGQASRNDGPAPAGDDRVDTVEIQQVTFDCEPPESATVEVRLLPAVPGEPVTALVQVIGGGSVRGESLVHLSAGSPATVRVEIDTGSLTPDGTVVVRSSDDPDLVFDEAAAVGCD